MEITSSEYPGERLVVCRNPVLGRDRWRRREQQLRDTETELARIASATRPDKNALVGKENIALRVGKAIEKRKVGKHFILGIGEDSFSYSRDEAQIAAEAALDGFYVICTSVPAEEPGPEETVAVYKGLSRAQRALRSVKTVDLEDAEVRPLRRCLADQVRAHVLLCVLAYHVEWHMRQRLAPMLSDAGKPEEGVADRESVVAPAERLGSAKTKARTKRTADGLPVQSFRALLSHLSTLTLNTCIQSALGEEHPIQMLSQPTEVQRKAFELLGVSPVV